MKNVFELYKLDWKRISKSKIMIIFLLGLTILPCLYCWLNVWALWDPYSNTSNLKIAVYSDDQTVKIEGKKINIGDSVTKELHKNKQLGWQFTSSKKQLDQGVKSGDYYAGIYIPKNFSKNISSITKGDIKKPTLVYSVNQKINAVAPRMTNAGANSLKSTITQEFVKTATKVSLDELKKTGFEIGKNLPALNRLKKMILKADEDTPEINSNFNKIKAVNNKLPEINNKVNEANRLYKSYAPKINSDAQQLVAANQYLPMVENAGRAAGRLQGDIPQIRSAGSKIASLDNNFGKISGTMDNSISQLQTGLTVVDNVEKVMPGVIQVGQNSENIAKNINNNLIPEIKKALPVIENSVQTGLSLVITISNQIYQDSYNLLNLVNQLESDPNNQQIRADIKRMLGTMKDKAGRLATVQTNLANTLQGIQDSYNSANPSTPMHNLDSAISNLRNSADLNTRLVTAINRILDNYDNLSTAELKSALSQLSSASKQIADNAAELKSLHIMDKVDSILTQMQSTLNSATGVLGSLNTEILPKIPGLLTNTRQILSSALSYLNTYKQDLPQIKATVHRANLTINGNMDNIVTGINVANNFYKTKYPSVKSKLAKASFFAQYQLPKVEADTGMALNTATTIMPKITTGFAKATNLIDDDWPEVRSGIHKAATKIRKGEKKNPDLKKLVNFLNSDSEKQADFISNPINLKTNNIYNVPNNGSASAPFYLTLCIWVGGLIVTSVLSMNYILSDRQKQIYSVHEQFFGRFLTFLTIVTAQGVTAALGNMWLLHTYVKEPVGYVIAVSFICFVFAAILYTIAKLFGTVGKAIGVIVLVFSVAGAGGNYPVVLSDNFFQKVNPFLPFTYAVNLVREFVGGVYWPNAWHDVVILILFAVGFLIFGALTVDKFLPLTEKFENAVRKSMIVH